MAVRSRRLLSSSAVPTGSGSSVVVDPDRTAIIKCVTFYNPNASSVDVFVDVETSPTSVRTILKRTLAATTSVEVTGLFVVATEGNTIRARRSGGAVSVTISGALLDGDPA